MFNGDNSINEAGQLAVLRAYYQLYAFPENNGEGKKMIRDLSFFDNSLYGLISPDGFSIVPMESKMATMSTPDLQKKIHFMMPFVKDGLMEMQKNMQLNVMFKKIVPTNQKLITLQPRRSFESPAENYDSYINELMIRFNRNIENNIQTKNVMNFNQYIQNFIFYLKNRYSGAPITLSEWNTSGLNSIFSTGLAVAISGEGFSSDSEKFAFKDHTTFEHYSNLAMNNGFMIHKNNPSILVADLANPITRNKLNTMVTHPEIETIIGFFNDNYAKANSLELDIIKNKLNKYYNDYVVFNKYERYNTITCANKTLTTFKERKNINRFSDKNYSSNQWTNIHLEIKNIEKGNPLSRKQMRDLLKKSTTRLDRSKYSSYNDYIDSFFKKNMGPKDFTMSDLQRRLDKQETKPSTPANMPTTGYTTVGGGGSSGGY